MELMEYIKQRTELQTVLLNFIDNDDDSNENLIIEMMKEQKILESREELYGFLHLISKISKNHRRTSLFFSKIEQILTDIETNIKQTFSNSEIFTIFQNNKRILLFLINKKIIIINKEIFYQMKKAKDCQRMMYLHYFYPEIKLFLKKNEKRTIHDELIEIDKDIFNNFEAKRQLGENDSFICKLIRNDSIEEFISYVTRTNLSLFQTKIKLSPFETNTFLIEQDESNLIEYAAFFGSIQIIKFLRINEVKLTSSLWLYSIHSNNAELIHLLEENHVEPKDRSFEECIKESIKCHHNDIANYIQNNLLDEKIEKENLENKYSKNILSYSFAYYNYSFFPESFNNEFIFFYLCHYNYYTLVKFLLETKKIDVNKKIISIHSFFNVTIHSFLIFNRILNQFLYE